MPTSHHHLNIDLATDDRGRKVLMVNGDVDLQTAPMLRRHIERTIEPGESLVIDLQHVTFMDSPGLGTLVHCEQTQRGRGAHLVVRNPSPPVRDLFDIVGLADVIHVEVDPPAR